MGLLLAVALVAAGAALAASAAFWAIVGREQAGEATTVAAGDAAIDIGEILADTEASVVAVRTGDNGETSMFGGAGTGVIITDDGLVLTNAHVVNVTGPISVTTSDGTEYPVELVGSVPEDDIALIRMTDPPAGIVPARLGSSDELLVGEPVVAIGNALGLGGRPTVTLGIVSAKERTIRAEAMTLRNLIQTDAAINLGNSGGPLLNRDGEVVGINTAVMRDSQNIGFAIPIDGIKPLIADIRDGKATITPESAFLGVSSVSVEQIARAAREEYEVEASSGAFVQEVVPGSAAEEAGLQVGDVIVAVDGESVSTSTDVVTIIRSHEAGETLALTVERRGETIQIDAVLKSRRDSGG